MERAKKLESDLDRISKLSIHLNKDVTLPELAENIEIPELDNQILNANISASVDGLKQQAHELDQNITANQQSLEILKQLNEQTKSNHTQASK